MNIPGFSVTAPWAFNWFLDGNANNVDISIVGTNGKFFLINAHGVLRRMGAVTEIPGTNDLFKNFKLIKLHDLYRIQVHVQSAKRNSSHSTYQTNNI